MTFPTRRRALMALIVGSFFIGIAACGILFRRNGYWITYPYAVGPAAFSPNGELFAATGNPRCGLYVSRVFSTDFTTIELCPDDNHRWLSSLSWHPNGQSLLIAPSAPAEIWVIDSQSYQILRRLAGHTGRVIRALYSPDGATIVSYNDEGVISVWDPESGTIRYDLPGAVADLESVAFDRSGELLVTVSYRAEVIIWNVAEGTEFWRLNDHEAVGYASLSPDNRYLVTAGTDSTIRVWDMDTRQEIHRYDGDGSPLDAKFSFDSNYILIWDFVDGRLIAWEFDTGRTFEKVWLNDYISVPLDWNYKHSLVAIRGGGGGDMQNVSFHIIDVLGKR